MTKISLFDFIDYKAYLNAYFEAQGGRSGQRLKAAEVVGCQTSYLSRVLKGDAHFSLEQAERMSRFLGHGKDESHYFLLIVQLDRAGSVELREYFNKQVETVLDSRNKIEKRVSSPIKLSEHDETIYYSSWKYAAVHMASLNKKRRGLEAISEVLSIPMRELRDIAEYLESVGIIEIVGGEIIPGPMNNVHLERTSPNITKHHTNWRLKAVQAVEQKNVENVHYSVVYSCSKTAFKEVKKRVLKVIEENAEQVKASEDETLAAFTLDFYELK
jgi:uncharacterized protein (TIGR02147 family)